MPQRESDRPPVNQRHETLNANSILENDMRNDPDAPDSTKDSDTKGDGPLAEELTGRASGTGEDLMSLFANGSDEHMRDGFRSGNGDDPETDVERNDDTPQIDLG